MKNEKQEYVKYLQSMINQSENALKNCNDNDKESKKALKRLINNYKRDLKDFYNQDDEEMEMQV